jgi:hypothetical protein
VASFRVRNHGYNSINLAHEPISYGEFDLKVHFPEGSRLTSSKGEIPVELTMFARKPCSFVLKVLLKDDLRTHYFVNISGTADDSVFVRGGGQAKGFIVDYMQALYGKAIPAFPESLARDPFLVEPLLREVLPSLTFYLPGKGKKEKIEFDSDPLLYLETLLEALKKKGLLLNTIRPCFLAPKSLFQPAF